MRVLLDTHAFIWFVENADRLPPSARAVVEQAEVAYVSIAAAWEMAIKSNLGLLRLSCPVDELVNQTLTEEALTLLPISLAHLRAVEQLPRTGHRDPFDRLLAAQAQVERLVVVSNDAKLDSYGVQRIW